ncbi:hypothetical protein BLA27_27605 [Brucella cytisi]|uniref:Uncharacterized protein n=1 Tax=Brucella cytisi TaxID=407152 RepID=A0A1J6HAZ8_9HYPH|nr:hypothetical protein BLA27_27605 [Brucella cytisi]
MTEGNAIIELWDVETFDSELLGDLDAHADVTRITCSPRVTNGWSVRPPIALCPIPRCRVSREFEPIFHFARTLLKVRTRSASKRKTGLIGATNGNTRTRVSA